MEQNDKFQQSRWERLKKYRDTGIVILIASGILAFYSNRLDLLFSAEGMKYFPTLHLSTGLLITTLFLIFQWVKATSDEIQMLQVHLGKFIPPLPRVSFYLIALIAVQGGITAYFSSDIIIFSALFAFYNLLNIWGLWIWNSQIEIGISEARKENDKTRPKISPEDPRHKVLCIIEAIEKYYLKRPQVQRCVTIMFFSFVALILGLLAHCLSDQYLGLVLLCSAYVIMILNIIISEVVIENWRRERDKAIGEP